MICVQIRIKRGGPSHMYVGPTPSCVKNSIGVTVFELHARTDEQMQMHYGTLVPEG